MKHTLHDLSGVWDFTFLGTCDPDAVDISQHHFDDVMAVPAAFDATPAYAGKRGVALYRKSLIIPQQTKARLQFPAVSLWCHIFIDGQCVKEHGDGYTEFWIDIPVNHQKTTRELVVMVDNQFSWERSPLHEEYFDFYQYGGITRPPTLHLLPDIYIKHATVNVTNWKEATLALSLQVEGLPEGNGEVSLEVTLDTQRVFENTVTVRNGKTELNLVIANPIPWNFEKPHLYHLVIKLDEDDYAIRFGLREIRVSKGQLLLNSLNSGVQGIMQAARLLWGKRVLRVAMSINSF